MKIQLRKDHKQPKKSHTFAPLCQATAAEADF
jgi:hypothetical protein